MINVCFFCILSAVFQLRALLYVLCAFVTLNKDYCFFLYYVCFYLRVNKDEYTYLRQAIVRWAVQSLPRLVGITWESLYESGSPTPLKGCVVRVAVHPRCSRSHYSSAPKNIPHRRPIRFEMGPTGDPVFRTVRAEYGRGESVCS